MPLAQTERTETPRSLAMTAGVTAGNTGGVDFLSWDTWAGKMAAWQSGSRQGKPR